MTHVVEILNKIGHSTACMRDISKIFAPMVGFSGLAIA